MPIRRRTRKSVKPDSKPMGEEMKESRVYVASTMEWVAHTLFDASGALSERAAASLSGISNEQTEKRTTRQSTCQERDVG